MIYGILTAIVLSNPQKIPQTKTEYSHELKLEKAPALETLAKIQEIIKPKEPPQPTLEEKIAANINNCTDDQWIRADNAECLDKPKPEPEQPIQASQIYPTALNTGSSNDIGTSTGLNGYEDGSCTGHVASLRYVPPGWGNASTWKWNALNAGWYVGGNPVAGAIGWRGNHVVYVLEVRGNTVLISEANYRYVRYETRVIEEPVEYYTYLY